MGARLDRFRAATHGTVRIWSSSADAPRLRRPTDVLLLVVSLLVLGVLTLIAQGTSRGEEVLDARLGWLWSMAYSLLTLWATWLVLLPAVSRHRRRLLVDQATAGALAFGAAMGIGALAGTNPSDTVSALVASGPPVIYVATRVGVLTAVVVVASPHLARPWRYASRMVLAVGAVASIGLGATDLLGAVAAIGVGVAAAAITHLVLGSPQGRLTDAEVMAALADLGVRVTRVTPAPARATGGSVLTADTTDAGQLSVRVYGRDAWDSQVVGSLWTALTRRGERAHWAGSRKSRVEHEALMTLLAAQAHVPTVDVVAVGVAVQGDALLVTRRPRATLSEIAAREPHLLTDELVADAWRALVRLHGAGIAHGHVDGSRVVLRTDGAVALADFDAAGGAADEGDLRTDQGQLLVATALAVGPDRAVSAALAALGADGLADVLPYLQPAALDRDERADVRERTWTLDELRAKAVAAAGVDDPPLERMRRVTPKSVGTVVLVGLLIYFVVSLLVGIDYASVGAALAAANWAWVGAALVLTPFVQVASAGATLGSTLARLRYLPVLMLQYAIQFIAIVIPASAARLALEVRFFQKFGIPAATALSFGVLDSFSGFLVQICLILVILVSGLPGFTESVLGGSSTADDGSNSLSLLAVLAVLLLLSAALTLAVPRLRHRLTATIPRIRAAFAQQVGAARSALGVLRRPGKVAAMLCGNLGVQLIQATVLALCLHAFGQSAYFSQLILINTAVSLFSGFMPIPGGVGVSEAGFTLCLQAVGIPSAIAVSTAITFRLVTFYLPPLWGGGAMRWLRRREYV